MKLLMPASRGEANRRATIRSWLESFGWEPDAEYRTEEGAADLYLPNHRVIIEVKKGGRLDKGPHVKGTGSARHDKNETAFEQVERYVKAERSRERLYLEDDIEDLTWIGAVTDGQMWWLWEWPQYGRGDMQAKINAWQGTRLNRDNIDRLHRLFDRTVGLPWAPENLAGLFRDDLDALQHLYQKNRDIRSTRTMRSLWLRQLMTSGNAPDEDEETLFVLHTFLICVSLAIKHSIMSDEKVHLGFADWVRQSSSQWYNDLSAKIAGYNWRQRSGDILRTLYMELVDVQHRKIYGEYYTPDWLAEKICAAVLDDRWIEYCIEEHLEGRHEGVLDPACGSGTFLFHAIRRIINSKPLQDNQMPVLEITDMLVSLVSGIDIHPVAVEMSKANILRALPSVPRHPLRVWQGDSLQTERADSDTIRLFEDPDALTIFSNMEVPIILPKQFLSQPSAMEKIDAMVRSANEGKPFSKYLHAGLDVAAVNTLRETYAQITDICRNEGNGVWAWHIINSTGPYLLMKDKVSRIVANPPWVVLSNIQDKRKREVEQAARKQNLWRGGEDAAKFDISALFVDKCINLYLTGDGLTGWVLPKTALSGCNWKPYRQKFEKKIVMAWDLGKLPFPKQSQACVNIVSKKERTGKKRLRLLKKRKGTEKLFTQDSWKQASGKVRWVGPSRTYPVKPSDWLSGRGANAYRGASLFPYCLTRVRSMDISGNMFNITTVVSRQKKWKDVGSRSGEVPTLWVRRVIMPENLLPYCVSSKRSHFVIPINKHGTAFENDPLSNRFWRDADDIFRNKRGKGSNTPKTLLDNIDFKGKLSKQLGRKNKHFVLCNNSGEWLCAARLEGNDIVYDSLYVAETKSADEALFLTAMLNSDALQPAYQSTKKTDRHFTTHFWHEIPLPRYNSKNEMHKKLATLAAEAEEVADALQQQERDAQEAGNTCCRSGRGSQRWRGKIGNP